MKRTDDYFKNWRDMTTAVVDSLRYLKISDPTFWLLLLLTPIAVVTCLFGLEPESDDLET